MPTHQELAQQARQKLVTAYGSEQAAQEAARRVRSGQFSPSDTLKMAQATGINDAAARAMQQAKAPMASAPAVPGAPVATVAPASPVAPAAPVSPSPAAPAAPKPLVPVATVNVGAVERPGIAASTASPVAPSGMGSPDADRFVSLSSKSPSELTDDDRAFLRQVNTKAALMGGINKALGIDGSTFQGNRVEATASGFTLYGQDGQPRQATPQEAEAIRRSSAGQNAVKVFQENETARKQAEAAAASLKSEEQRRQEARTKQLTEYEQVLRQAADKSVATIREQGRQRKNSVQNNFSAMGGGRSTDAMKSVDEVQKAIDEQVSVEEKKYQAQVQAYLLQQQGADEEALKPYRDAVRQADLQLGQLQATAFQRMQEANAAGAVQNEQALQNLLNTMTTQAKSELALTGFDEKESARLGYFVRKDAQGNVSPMVGKDGEPIQFKSATVEAQKPVKIGEDAKGRDIMGVYNTQTGKYEPLAYGVAAARTGGAIGTGGIRDAGTSVKAPAQIADAAGNFDFSGKNIDYFMAYTTGIDRFLKGKKPDEKEAFMKEYESVVPAIKKLENDNKELAGLYKLTFDRMASDAEQAALARNFYGSLANGNIEGAKNVLVQRLASPKAQDSLAEADEFVRNLADLKQAMAKIKPGLLTGGLEGLANMAGKSSDPDVSEAAAIARNLVDILQRSRSGAAAPEAEVKRFANLMGRISASDTLNDANLNAMLKSVSNAKRSALGNKLTDKQFSDLFERAGDIGKALDIAKKPTEELRKQAESSKTYKVTDSTGQTEEVTAESFWKQAQDQYDAAINAGDKALADRIEAESERLAKQNGIPNPQ